MLLVGCSGTPRHVGSGQTPTDTADSDGDTTVTAHTADTAAAHTADTGPPVDTGPFFTVQPGTGEAGFTPLAPDDPVEIIYGFQGGWHMLGALRVCNMSAPFDVHFQITDVASGEIVADQYYVQWMLIDEGNGCRYTYNLFGFLNVTALVDGELDTPPELLDGHTMQMLYEVTDTLGRQESGSIEVLAWSL